MATLAELQAAVDDLLGITGSGQLLQLNSNTLNRAYEAYVFGLCAKAVRSVGGTAVPTGITSGANPPQLVFRGGPGQMFSRDQDFCYLDCRLNTKRFEVHLDVTYEGMSGANHEIDISIVDAGHASQVRGNTIMPRTNKNLIGAIECKFYDSSPGVSLVRTFVGLLRDCSPNRVNAFVANRSTSGIDMFLSKSWAPKSFVDLSPDNEIAENRFVWHLGQELKQWSYSR
jgi:hypothetical protein